MADLAKNPRIALRGATDHQAVGAGLFKHLGGLLRGLDVAVGEHRDAHRRADGGDGGVLGLAAEALRACAAVHRQRGDARVLGDARDVHAVAFARTRGRCGSSG
jgi:hypothetical protein